MRIPVPQPQKESRPTPKLLPYILVGLVSFLAGMVFVLSGKNAINSAVDDLKSEVRLYQTNPLQTIFLDIPYESLDAIQKKRDEALARGILLASDEDFVPASMRLNEGTGGIRIKLRLKGDFVDHLEGDKWSFRIHITENDESVFGMQRFSLQAPETRNFLSEWGYHEHLLAEDVLTTRYHFVNVVLNGEHKGIYALEESFTQDLLESQGRREGIIFRYNEDLFWEYLNQLYNISGSGYVTLLFADFDPTAAIRFNEMEAFRGNRIARNETLSAEGDTAYSLLNSFTQENLASDQVLDEQLWGRFMAISDLWSADHALRWHNLRFYYNPINAKIEPVAFDGGPMGDPQFGPLFNSPESIQFFLENPGVLKSYIETLERITTPEYLNSLRASQIEEFDTYYTFLQKEYGKDTPHLIVPWETLNFRGELIRTNLTPIQEIRGSYTTSILDNQSWIELDLINLLNIPVQIQKISVGGIDIVADGSWCDTNPCGDGIFVYDEGLFLDSGTDTRYLPVALKIPLGDREINFTAETVIYVETNIIGSAYQISTPVTRGQFPIHTANSPVAQASLEEVLDAHEFIFHVSGKQLAVEEGDWNVEGDLVIPRGYQLNISGNTTLRFGQENALITFAPLVFLGTEDEPITLTAQDQSWAGIAVIEAEQLSEWEYVRVEKTNSISREGWILTGGVTFYKSPVSIRSSKFEYAIGEDALNVVQSDFKLELVEFSNTASDAFDGDFTTGEVVGCSFHEISGDGVDVSGSEISVRDSTFVNIFDKALSIGENSRAQIMRVRIQDVGMGIASKDLSSVHVSDSSITSANVVGIAAYIKKPQYGPAEIIATDLIIENTTRLTLNQTGNFIELNSEIIAGEDLDVDSLYTTN